MKRILLLFLFLFTALGSYAQKEKIVLKDVFTDCNSTHTFFKVIKRHRSLWATKYTLLANEQDIYVHHGKHRFKKNIKSKIEQQLVINYSTSCAPGFFRFSNDFSDRCKENIDDAGDINESAFFISKGSVDFGNHKISLIQNARNKNYTLYLSLNTSINLLEYNAQLDAYEWNVSNLKKYHIFNDAACINSIISLLDDVKKNDPKFIYPNLGLQKILKPAKKNDQDNDSKPDYDYYIIAKNTIPETIKVDSSIIVDLISNHSVIDMHKNPVTNIDSLNPGESYTIIYSNK